MDTFSFSIRFACRSQTEAERKFRRMKEEESYFDRDDDDDDNDDDNDGSGQQECSSPYFRHRGGNGEVGGDDDDEDTAFDMRLAALQAASKVAETAKGRQEAIPVTKNGKPVLKNLLPYEDSDSD